MTDTNPVLVSAQGDQPEVVDLGTVAAQNLAVALNVGEEHVPKIKQAINDEINALASHFTLAFADVQTLYEAEVAKLKAAASGVAQNTCERCERMRAKFDQLFV